MREDALERQHTSPKGSVSPQRMFVARRVAVRVWFRSASSSRTGVKASRPLLSIVTSRGSVSC